MPLSKDVFDEWLLQDNAMPKREKNFSSSFAYPLEAWKHESCLFPSLSTSHSPLSPNCDLRAAP